MSKLQQRAKISIKNKYYIPKFRYLELKNFCLQYNDWKLALKEISLIRAHLETGNDTASSNPTEEMAAKRIRYVENINLIEETAKLADPLIAKWIVKGVTESYTYEYLHLKLEMPASRDMYYDRYRRFFWILDKKRS